MVDSEKPGDQANKITEQEETRGSIGVIHVANSTEEVDVSNL